LLALGQQVVAPGDRAVHRLLPLGPVHGAVTQERQTALEPCRQRLRRKQQEPRSGELDCKRQALEMIHDRGDGRRVCGCQLELRRDHLRALHEERHGRVALQRADRVDVLGF
jgi:hypothetical protein